MKNSISEQDVKKMWTPWLVFDNILDLNNDVSPTDLPNSFLIDPNQDYNFQMDDKTNFRNTKLFKGDENVIHQQKQITVKWVCDFDLRWYPRWSPENSKIISLPSDILNSIFLCLINMIITKVGVSNSFPAL